MSSFMDEDQIDLTDNIISRHFNRSLSGELFNFDFKPQLPSKNKNGKFVDDLSTNKNLSDNYMSNQIDEKYQMSTDLNNVIKQNNQNLDNQKYNSNQEYLKLNPKEVILNRNDKIRDLINDCELINNNNINNFVTSKEINDEVNRQIRIVPTDRCRCKCHCTDHKKKNPFHQIIKTNKLLNSLSKIKLNGGTNRSIEKYVKKMDLNDDYALAPSPSNYSSLSSGSSISSQTISLSSYSSLQDNYNYMSNKSNSTSHLAKPSRKPPSPPPIRNSEFHKAPAKLPSYGKNVEKLSERSISSPTRSTKEYERVITKSFENLLGIKTDKNDEKSPELDYEESIYETIDSDFDECSAKDDEDLYQDIELLNHDEEIYESLNNMDILTKSNEAVYVNNQTDQKLTKQQKALEKKRKMQAEKLRKKFGLTGQEIPLMSGIIKENVKANGLNLALNKDEVVLVLRIEKNPPGLWLAKNERGKIGYIDLNIIDVDVELFKNLMNEPNALKS